MVTQGRRITVKEFDTFLVAPENRDKHFQLFAGPITEKVVTQQHGIIAVNIKIA